MEYILDDYGSETPEGYSPDAIYGQKQFYCKPLDEMNQRYYDVAVAASITGWVRAFLWKSINAVTDPFYCDTDSIICRSKGNLLIGDQLGEWKMEGKADRIAIAGKKLYACRLTPEWKNAENGGWKTACKGVRLTPAEIVSVARGKTVTYYSDAPTFSFLRGANFLQRKVAPRFTA